MIAAALAVVTARRVLSAVIFAGALSAFAALLYVLLGAPDVALAEVVVGATLATVIYLATLKKYRIFTVYLTGFGEDEAAGRISARIELALKDHALAPHFVHSREDVTSLLRRPGCDLVIEHRGQPLPNGTLVLHREEHSQFVREILDSLKDGGFSAKLEDSLSQSVTGYKEERL